MQSGKKVVVILNDRIESLNALYFVTKLFTDHKNLIDIVYMNDHFVMDHSSKSNLQIMKPTEIESEEVRTGLIMFLLRLEEQSHAKATLHKQVGSNTEELTWRCQFADLLVTTASGYRSLTKAGMEEKPLLETPKGSSPFIIVPENFRDIDNILIAYGAKGNNINAIKQFCYLFGEMCSHYDVNLLQVFSEGNNPFQLKEERLFVEYLKQHCSRLAIHKYIGGESVELLQNYISYSHKTLVVSNSSLLDTLNGLLGSNAFSSTEYDVSSTQFISHV